MTRKTMVALFILAALSCAHGTKSVTLLESYKDEDDNNTTQSSSSSSSELRSDADARSPSLSESDNQVVEPLSYPYVIEIIAKNTRHKVASSFVLEGTQMTVLSDEIEPIKPEAIAYLKKNGVMKTDQPPQEWSAKVVNLHSSKMPKPMEQLTIGKFILFYGDGVREGDIVSCASILEIGSPKHRWKVSDKKFYLAFEHHPVFLDYHRFIEPREEARQREAEQRREDERDKRRKRREKRGEGDDNYDPYSPLYDSRDYE